MISVLMSVYNETKDELEQSIESILTQTYKKIELIVVIDNPKKGGLYKKIIDNFNDDRVRVMLNNQNIGLANSINKAANIAEGTWLARMDADDISDKFRLEVEHNYLVNNPTVKLVCTNFDYIDEDNNKIGFSIYSSIQDEEICQRLPLRNIVHHPTVMIEKEIFMNLGGYRNFPCAQDYDLWLRYINAGGKVHFINNIMLHYRIRGNSVTAKRKVKQMMTGWYIQNLFFERINKKNDSYSINNYERYLKEKKYSDEMYRDYELNKDKSSEIVKCVKAGNINIGLAYMIIKILITSRFFRWMYFHYIKIHIKLAYYRFIEGNYYYKIDKQTHT